MSEQIVAAAMLLISIMIGVAVWLVRQGVKSALAPLSQLEAEAAQRSSTNLTPLDPLLAPQEVRGLIGSINQMMQRLSHSIEAQSRFIANAAHQRRTPIAGLRLQAQIALKDKSSGDVTTTMREIEDSAARASHLIEQLLVLSKAEGSSAMTLQDVYLTALAHQVIERFLPQAIRHQVDLGYEGSSEPVLVSGNEVLLTELLGNLVDNAIRYGRIAGTNGRVTVATTVCKDEVQLGVSDDGPGFGTSDQNKLFQRFYRPDSAEHTDSSGAGLGLATVKEIADRHGARISIAPTQACRITIQFKPLST